MKRRDTIIIAVLVNAGLLLVLFATAMRSNKKDESKELSKTSIVQEEVPIAMPEIKEGAPVTNLAASDPLALALNENPEQLALNDEIDIPLQETEAVTVVPAPVATPPSPVEPIATPTPKAEQTTISVTVKKGDALEKIARAHKTSVNAIMKANNLSNSNLKIGQVLKVPTNEVASKKESSPAKAASEYYTVKEGDNPWLIASRNHVKLDELLKLNGMDETKAKKLKPGDKLRIR